MIVICRTTIAENTRLQKMTGRLTYDYKHYLDIGEKYLVMGMMLPKGSDSIHHLIDRDGWTHWLPCSLFDISNNSLPLD